MISWQTHSEWRIGFLGLVFLLAVVTRMEYIPQMAL